MLEEILNDGFTQLGLNVSPEAVQKLRIYKDTLEETNKVMNLTAIEGDDNIARLHFLDCAALLTCADFQQKKVIDVGTGAGFPGLVLKTVSPDLRLTLVDSLDKRVNFLKSTCEKLSLTDVECFHLRAEEAPKGMRGSYDIATARAVAGLNVLSELCLPFVKKGGLFIAMKGPDCQAEVDSAGKAIATLGGRTEKIVRYTIPGTDIVHSAVIIKKVSGTPPMYPRRWAQIKKSPL